MDTITAPCTSLPPSGPRPSSTVRPAVLVAIGAAHVLALWAMLQADAWRVTLREVAPLMVAVISAVPEAPSAPPPAALPLPAAAALPRVLLPVPAAEPWRVPAAVETTPQFERPAAPMSETASPVATPMPPPNVAPAGPAAPPAPQPPLPRVLPASTIAYLSPPPIELPLASRRLGEQGTVLLRVLVGADGLPRQVSVHRSSGHARLDEQALWAMKRARFAPQVENGAAIEWIVIAPLQYELD